MKLTELLVLIVDSTAFFTWTLLMVSLLQILSRFVTTSNVYMTAKLSWIWCFIQIYISGFRLLYRSIGKLLHTRYSTLHWTKLLKISWSHVLPSLIFFLKNSLSSLLSFSSSIGWNLLSVRVVIFNTVTRCYVL